MTNLKPFSRILFFVLSALFFFSSASVADDENYSPLDSPSFFEGLNTFTAVFSQIKQMYVDEVDDETLFNNAIRGLIEGLDPHSSFLEPVDQSKVSIIKSSLNGLVSSAGTVLNSSIKNINDNPEQGELVYTNNFNGNSINSVIRSSGVIFENEDLTSFGAIVARDFDKPSMVKTKVKQINSVEPAETHSQTEEPEFTDDDLERIKSLLSELENELIELNMKYAADRQSGKEVDNDKAKIISDLEWQIREVRTKINPNQQ